MPTVSLRPPVGAAPSFCPSGIAPPSLSAQRPSFCPSGVGARLVGLAQPCANAPYVAAVCCGVGGCGSGAAGWLGSSVGAVVGRRCGVLRSAPRALRCTRRLWASCLRRCGEWRNGRAVRVRAGGRCRSRCPAGQNCQHSVIFGLAFLGCFGL